MKRSIPSLLSVLFIGLLIGFLLPLTAHAQGDSTVPGFGLGALFTNTAALAAAVIAVVGFIRGHVWTALDGWAAIAFTFAVSVGMALAGFYLKLLSVTTAAEAVSFGVAAAVIAMGLVKTGMKIAGTGTPSTDTKPTGEASTQMRG